MSKGFIKTLAMISPILITGILGLCTIPQEADGVGQLIGTIKLFPDTQFTEVHSGTSGMITFYGEIQITQQIDVQNQYALVDLNVHAEPFNATDIQTLVIMPGMTIANFTFSIILPYDIPYPSENESVFEMTIDGSWVWEPGIMEGEITEKKFVVMASQYYQYTVKSDTAYIQTSPGGDVEIQLDITNDGNGPDRIELSVKNRDMLEEMGWTIRLFTSDFNLPYGETITVKVPVSTPVKWSPYENGVTQIHFLIRSKQAPVSSFSEEVDYYVFIRQRGVGLPGFDVPVILISILSVCLLSLIKRR